MSALSTAARNEYVVELADSLPPPAIDQREYRERRLTAAVEAFNALRAGNAYEGQLAVRIVLCGAHAVECLREAALYRDDFPKMTSCRAQAASMVRENSAKRTLEREQRLRLAGEAVAGGALVGSTPGPAAVAAGLPRQSEVQPAPPPSRVAAAPPLSAPEAPVAAPSRLAAANPEPSPALAELSPALAELSPAPADLSPAPAEPSPVLAGLSPALAELSPNPAAPSLAPVAPLPAPAAPSPAPSPAPAGSVPPPSPEAIAQAEALAYQNIVAAAQIRHDRGVTPQNKACFRHLALPTDPAVIDALVRGSSEVLTILDDVGGETLDEAA